MSEKDKDVPTREFLKTIQAAYAKIDPKVAESKILYRKEFENIFTQAGLSPIFIEEIPNEYCSQHCCFGRPWFVVTSRLGRIKLGWRKSVISIEWKDSSIKANGEELFKSEDVTKWKTGVHAWSDQMAIKYLRALGDTV